MNIVELILNIPTDEIVNEIKVLNKFLGKCLDKNNLRIYFFVYTEELITDKRYFGWYIDILGVNDDLKGKYRRI